MSGTQMTQVLAAPDLDPGAQRISLEVPQGLTIAQIVAAALPNASEADLATARVALVTQGGSAIVLRGHWHRVRPRDGVRVVIRLIPGKDALRTVLMIVVSVAAVALGGVWGPSVAGWLGVADAVGTALVSAGVSILGNLLVNALVPPVKPDNDRATSYSIAGWKNKLDPNGAVPVVFGTMRYAPPFGAMPYTEIVGDDQYMRALFLVGEGEVNVTDMRIGETSLSEYDEVETEIRYGVAGELPVSIYPRQVVEEQTGVELTRPLPRDDAGKVISGEPAEETPVVRTTGADASACSVILAWPGGLIYFNDKGKKRPRTVRVRIEQRLVEAEEWQLVETLEITAAKAEGFYRQHTWTLPSRARWQVRLTMLTAETEDSRIQQRTTWAALQTIRPEYPLDNHRPMALVALRVKATHQLSGPLDNFNCLISRICNDWDAATSSWQRRVGSNPASALREALQHPSNPKPVSDVGIDLEELAEFHAFCEAKGLTYNRVLDQTGTTFRDVLTEIAAAGRATPRHDGTKWGVVIDRPSADALIVDHVNPMNSWGFRWTRTYLNPPDAFVVTFPDADNDYKETQRTIPWPGHAGDIELTEELSLPGKVHAAEVWREARRRQLETVHRPDSYQATQEGAPRVATRGDNVMLSHYVLSRVQMVARVISVSGTLVALSNLVEMEDGTEYALRFRVFANETDTVGTSVTRRVRAVAGETDVLILTEAGDPPGAGDIVHFGPVGVESYQQIVRNVEITEDQCSILRLVDAAPQIDQELETTEIPAWSSRVGEEIAANLLQPGAPRFAAVRSGLSGTETEGLITYLIAPGSGAITTAGYQIEHRLDGAGDWALVTLPAANGGGQLDGYNTGDVVQLRALGRSFAGIDGPYSTVVTITVGAEDAPIPAALDEEAVSVTTLLGGALIQIGTGDDDATAAVQVYRSMSAVLDRETDAVGAAHAVEPQQSYSIALGDTTRSTLITGGAMDNPADWTIGADWSIAGGVASHSAGSAGAITQGHVAEAGKWYRIGLAVSGYSAGQVMPRLTGGSDRPGTAITANGQYSDRIQAASGNDHIEFLASGDFDGAIDNAVLYLETAACLTQGTHYLWIEPQNAEGAPGPAAGPFTLTII